MLQFGQQLNRNCGRLTRRELLQAGSLGVLGLSLSDLLRMESLAKTANEPTSQTPKSVILLWLWGGPSHLDTFDLKPKAPTEYRGPYSPIATNVDGIQICELLPKLAKMADKYSIIRSLHHTSNDHGIAGTIGLTGSDRGAISLGGKNIPGQLKPTHGSITSRVLGFDPTMPRFVTVGGHLHQGHKPIRGEGGGSLGSLHDPFRLDFIPGKGVQLPQLDLIKGTTREGLSARRDLLKKMDRADEILGSSPSTQRFNQFHQQAFSLLTSPKSRKVFDLEREKVTLRRRYGRFRFGQCCLMARRLVEAGSRFVQVNWSSHVEPVEDTGDGGWDMHDRNFQQFQDRHAWMLDQAVSTLLTDLEQRGMLDDTVVVAVGEFGRTPKINGKAGRDHWHHCYSGLVAGGGFRTGLVIGSSDRRAEHPASNPLTPADLFTTVLSQIGIGTTQLTSVGLTPLGRLIEKLT